MMFGQSFAQNWLRVGSGLPFHFANANNEVIEFNGDMYSVGYVYNGISGSPTAYTPKVFKLSAGVWSEVGTGFAGSATTISNNIHAIAEFNAELYIAGIFVLDNGVDAPFNNVAKWDNANSRWVQVGDGTGSGVVNELTVFDGKLYAGGNFSDLGAAGTNNIAVWAGTSWAAVGSGISTDTNGADDDDQIMSMVVYDNELIVGGKFSTAGGILAHNIAKWDGTDWAYLKGTLVEGGGGVGGFNSGQVYVMSLQVFGTDLFIGGTFTTYYNVSYLGSSTGVPNHLVVWSGTSFSAPTKATPSNNRINAMTVFDNRIYIGNINESNIYSWDGGIFNWRLEPDRDPLRQRATNFYANATDIYYAQSYGVYQLFDPVPTFFASATTVCAGQSVTFTDQSSGTNILTAWNWTFEGGTPATSTDQNPVVTFATGGPYDVTLAVTSSDGTNNVTNTDYITVADIVDITSQPIVQSVCSNEVASFSVSVTGTGGVTYQWQIKLPGAGGFTDLVNDASISGATGSTLSYSQPSIDIDGAIIRCAVTNGCSTTAISSEVALNVTAGAEITEQATAQAICVSGDASFTVNATVSSGTITYQWQYLKPGNIYTNLTDAGVYSETSTATLSITGADNTLPELYDADNGDGKTQAIYRCVLTVNGCTTNSGLTYLNIHDAPTVTTDPVDATKCDSGSGVSATFSVTSSLIVGGLSYQWQVDDGSSFVNITDDAVYSGANSKDLSLAGATSALSGYIYRCEIGACAAPVYSASATLTIDNAPVITLQPGQVDVCVGSDAEFSVAVTGTNLSYQWQERAGSGDFVDIINNDTYFASDGTLQIIAATGAMHNYRYRCVITSGTCTQNSATPSLKVYAQPSISGAPFDRTACEGGNTVSFIRTVSGFNAAVHSYQWQVAVADSDIFTDITDDVNYGGITIRHLTVLAPAYVMNGNKYRLKVNGCVTDVVSDAATLTVNQLPLITTSPQSQTVCPGEEVIFTAKSEIGTDVKYQWMVDQGTGYTNLGGQASAGSDGFSTKRLSAFEVHAGLSGYKYKCVARSVSPCSQDQISESLEATLTVNEVTLLTQPENATICRGENATFSVTAQGEGLTYQWQESGSDIADGGVYSGATTATLTITGATQDLHGKNYKCVVSGNCTDVTSIAPALIVYGVDKPTLTLNIGNPQAPQLFVDNVSGDNYTWFLDGTSYTDGGNSSSVNINQAGSYSVIVSLNGCPSEESDAQVIVVTGFENSLSANGVNVYPNPVSNKLTLEMSNDFNLDKGAHIIITNVNGKEFYSRNYNSLNSRKTEIDMSSYESGIYLLRVINGDKMASYKIQKQ